jgi:hypothetical protein
MCALHIDACVVPLARACQDPTLFCSAFKKSRFFMFTRREPEEPDADDQVGRDVFNEKPSKEDLALAEREARGPLPRLATINTSYGEIRLKLFPDECPKVAAPLWLRGRAGRAYHSSRRARACERVSHARASRRRTRAGGARALLGARA